MKLKQVTITLDDKHFVWNEGESLEVLSHVREILELVLAPPSSLSVALAHSEPIEVNPS